MKEGSSDSRKKGNHERKRKHSKSKNISEASKSEKSKKRKRAAEIRGQDSLENDPHASLRKPITFPHRFILAPMVGASELAFRLLVRRYGAQAAYTPMMSAQKFATDADYRKNEFQTCEQDRPLVCHFGANDPQEFAAAARLAEPYCDAIDLNLGCPQRTAYVGHFGSYLLDDKDRTLVCDIVRAGAKAVQIPICCKIRLLDTLDDTVRLCRDLRDAGASLIAVHARYRASWERKGPGARDGPALLDQVTKLKQVITDIPIIANGNTITFQDVQDNLQLTGADGLMSAEGILDNPTLFLPRLGERGDSIERSKSVAINKKALPPPSEGDDERKHKLEKKLRKITRIEKKVADKGLDHLDDEEKRRLRKKAKLQEELQQLIDSSTTSQPEQPASSLDVLYKRSENMVLVAHEYLDLVTQYPIKMRTVIFHTRRMLKSVLEQYQLMEQCLGAESIDEIRSILDKITHYQDHPESFVFDTEQARREKEALERKRQQEGKRKAFEARMIRKAKREGKTNLLHYLNVGAQVPTTQTIARLRSLPRAEALEIWKQHHSQHCLAFHLDAGVNGGGGGADGGCTRGRACAFLHMEAVGSDKNGNSNAFEEKDEVAG